MSNRNKIYFAVYSVAGMLALFFVPYYFPHKNISAVSTSIDYGFNNQAGILILFLLSLGLVLYAWLSRQDTNPVKYSEIISSESDHVLDKAFKVYMTIQILFCLMLCILLRNTLGMNESAYFFTRLHDVIMGRKLYVEVDFAYGALLLYIPMLLYKFLSLFVGIRIMDAYSVSLMIMQCVSFYWLYKIMSRLKIEALTKKIIFVALFIATLPYSTGYNYILFRFVPPYVLLFYMNDRSAPPPISIFY